MTRDLEDETLNLLHDLMNTLHDYADVRDGHDGFPRPNAAMSAQNDIERLIARIERERQSRA